MATTLYNGSSNGSSVNGTSGAYTFYLEVILNSQSVANNTSNITINHYAKGNSGYNYEQYSSPKSYIKIYDNNSGTTVTKKTTAVNAIGSSKVKIGTWTGNVTHKLDGTLTINVTAEYKPNDTTWYLPANKSLSSGNLVLTPLHKVPVVNSFTITENNQQLINAGISDDTFVARLSNKTINANVTYYDNATLTNLKTVVGTTIYDSSANPTVIDLLNCNIASNTVLILVEATDSLNAKGVLGVSKTAIPYILPTLTPTSSNIRRNGQTSGKVKMSLKGTFYNANVGNMSNAIQLQFAYWKNGESESETYYTIPSTAYSITNNSIEMVDWPVEVNGEEITNVNKSYSYTFRIKATDSFGKVSIIDLLCVSGEYLMCKYKDKVDFKKITVKGIDYITEPRVLLWSGNQTRDGDTIQLSDSIQNYRFLLLRVGNTINHILAPVIPNNTAVRGNCTYTGVNNIELISFTGITGNDFKSITQTRMLIYILKTSGITANTNYTGIVEVWGIR